MADTPLRRMLGDFVSVSWSGRPIAVFARLQPIGDLPPVDSRHAVR
jgi:hypothetical protein